MKELIGQCFKRYHTFNRLVNSVYSGVFQCRARSSVVDDLWSKGQRVCILQPRIKSGRNRDQITSADLHLAEAVTLVNTLRDWKVVDTVHNMFVK